MLLLTGQENLWRTAGSGADLAEAVPQYEAATGRGLYQPIASPSRGCSDAGAWRAVERLLGRTRDCVRDGAH